MLGWTEQGKAFFIIEILVSIICLFFEMIKHAENGKIVLDDEKIEPCIVILAAGVMIAGYILVSHWLSKLFEVNFFVAYELIIYGSCLAFYPKKRKKKEKKSSTSKKDEIFYVDE